ncbi:MAG: ATP-binding protein [Acidimicrobiales bacterium]
MLLIVSGERVRQGEVRSRDSMIDSCAYDGEQVPSAEGARHFRSIRPTPLQAFAAFAVLASIVTWASVSALSSRPGAVPLHLELVAVMLSAGVLVLALVNAVLCITNWQLRGLDHRWLAFGVGFFLVACADAATTLRRVTNVFGGGREDRSPLDAGLPLSLLIAALCIVLWWRLASGRGRAPRRARAVLSVCVVAIGLVSVSLLSLDLQIIGKARLAAPGLAVTCLAGIAWSSGTRRNFAGRIDGVLLVTLGLIGEACIASDALPLGSSRELIAVRLFELEGFVLSAVALAIRVVVGARMQAKELDGVLSEAEALSDVLESIAVDRDGFEHEVRSALLFMNSGLNLLEKSTTSRSAPGEVFKAAAYLRHGTVTLASLVAEKPSSPRVFDVIGIAQIEVGVASLLGVEVTLEVDDDAPHRAAGDPTVFARVLREFLDNVRLHAPGAHAVVTVRRTPDGIEVGVEDDGPGIGGDPSQALVWGWREEGALGPGQGYGLAIARHLFERDGEGIAISRGHGDVGTLVTVRLPNPDHLSADYPSPIPRGSAARPRAIEGGVPL